jgi:hypothetical protein
MFQSYPDIEYDEKTRRLNRLMKLLALPFVALLIGGAAYGISQIDFRSGPVLINDTQGRVECVHLDSEDSLHYVASLAPDDEERVANRSACSVFSRNGDYVGCVVIPRGANKDERLRASDAQTRVKAGECAYPR